MQVGGFTGNPSAQKLKVRQAGGSPHHSDDMSRACDTDLEGIVGECCAEHFFAVPAPADVRVLPAEHEPCCAQERSLIEEFVAGQGKKHLMS